MGLDEQIAAAYGVRITTAPLVPLRSARLESLVLAAEQVALAIGDHRPRRRRAIAPDWTPLPVATRSPSVDRTAALANLLTWAAGGGAVFDGVEIATSPDGNRSVIARRAFAEGAAVMIVPRRLMVIDSEIETSALASAIATVAGELRSGHTVVSAWLATERARTGSPWQSYLDALPDSFPHMPMFRGSGDFDELQGTCARLAVIEARDSVADDHAVLARLAPLTSLSLAEFAWARSILASRAFKIDLAGQDSRALVPIADMFDHSHADATWHYDDEQQAFVVSALRPIAAGEEIGFSYGSYDNGRYLVGYGFAVADNPDDEAALRFATAADSHADLTGHLLWNLPLGNVVPLPISTHFDDRARRALSVARLRASSPRERIAAADRGRLYKNELRWLGSRIEQAALAELAAATRAGLKALAARDRPATDHATPWQGMIQNVRHSEQAVLAHILSFTAAATRYATTPDAWSWRRAAEEIPEDATGPDRLLRGYLLATAAELPR